VVLSDASWARSVGTAALTGPVFLILVPFPLNRYRSPPGLSNKALGHHQVV
jgi:hypothetical protein